jgi:co-chaperonin GroES (HSP10)
MKRARMQAMGNYVIIEPLAKKTQTEGGLQLSDRSQKESDFCTVTSIGPLVTTLEIGDVVLNTAGGHEFSDEATGRKVYICEETDLAVKMVETLDANTEEA